MLFVTYILKLKQKMTESLIISIKAIFLFISTIVVWLFWWEAYILSIWFFLVIIDTIVWVMKSYVFKCFASRKLSTRLSLKFLNLLIITSFALVMKIKWLEVFWQMSMWFLLWVLCLWELLSILWNYKQIKTWKKTNHELDILVYIARFVEIAISRIIESKFENSSHNDEESSKQSKL